MEANETLPSIDEQVGAVVGDEGVADQVLKYLLDRMKATGDKSRADEIVEERYDPKNYERLLVDKALRESSAKATAERAVAASKHLVGAAGWSVAKAKLEQSNDPARYLSAIAACQDTEDEGERDAAIHKALGIVTPDLAKTLNISTPGAGGLLTEGDEIDNFFRPLRNEAIVLRFGPIQRSIIDGAITVTGLETDVAIVWNDEIGSQELTSEPTWGDRKRPTDFADVIVPISNKALASRASTQILRDVNGSIRHGFVIGFDQAWINGTGTSRQPKGLRAYAQPNVPSGGNSFDNIVDDAKGCFSRMAQNSVPMRKLGWMMSKREFVELQFLRDTNDRFAFQRELANGTWFGAQIESTNEIAVNENGDESFVLLADFNSVLIGNGTQITTRTFDQASYTVNAVVRNAAERKETLIMASAETTLLVAQSEHIEEISGVRWGA